VRIGCVLNELTAAGNKTADIIHVILKHSISSGISYFSIFLSIGTTLKLLSRRMDQDQVVGYVYIMLIPSTEE